jgi:hypothetical protein
MGKVSKPVRPRKRRKKGSTRNPGDNDAKTGDAPAPRNMPTAEGWPDRGPEA